MMPRQPEQPRGPRSLQSSEPDSASPRSAPQAPFAWPAALAAGRGLRQLATLASALSMAWAAWGHPPALPALGLDAKGVTVSGLSSGGYMAAQFEVAHAASVRGAGIVAAGPYGCSMGSVFTAALTCSCPYDLIDGSGPIGLQTAITRLSCIQLPAFLFAERAMRAAAGNAPFNDSLTALRRHRVWLYSGDADPVVAPTIVDGLEAFYARAGVPARQVKRVKGPRAGHGMPVASLGDCEVTRSPYLSGCEIDGAGDMLKWLYNRPRQAPGVMQPAALQAFDQSPYRLTGAFDGLDSTGWVYIPERCQTAGRRCKLHVVFHGCEQGQNFPAAGVQGAPVYGPVFVEQAGYNRWAESLGVVMLYPQVLPSTEGGMHSPFRYNPKGCWDFWGYTSVLGDASLSATRPPFARKDAPQMRAVKAMIDALLARP